MSSVLYAMRRALCHEGEAPHPAFGHPLPAVAGRGATTHTRDAFASVALLPARGEKVPEGRMGGLVRNPCTSPSPGLRPPSPRCRGARGHDAHAGRICLRGPSPRARGEGARRADGGIGSQPLHEPLTRPSATLSPLSRGEGPRRTRGTHLPPWPFSPRAGRRCPKGGWGDWFATLARAPHPAFGHPLPAVAGRGATTHTRDAFASVALLPARGEKVPEGRMGGLVRNPCTSPSPGLRPPSPRGRGARGHDAHAGRICLRGPSPRARGEGAR